jgi:hypothetical protein
MSLDALTHDQNPYATPQPAASDEPLPLSAVQVKARLRTPAYGLMASAIWGIGVAIFLGTTLTLEKLSRLPRFTEQDQHEVATYACMLVAFIFVGVSIARGAWAMLTATDFFAARNAAILALLPCGGAWIIGFPFGLWALWVLRDPRVRHEFRRRQPWRIALRQAASPSSPPA